MIMRLFSVFDPTSYFGVSFNWVILMIILIFVPLNFYFLKRGYGVFFDGLIFNAGNTFKDIGANNYLGIRFVCVGTFVYLIFRNLLGLFPFVFTGTAHPILTLGWGFVFWISFFSIGWLKNFKIRCAHLVPEGSPIGLAPLIVLIERISHLIRPFTLSIRLAANIMAGHLIVGLLRRIRVIGIFGFINSLFLQSILLILEFGVSVIQGFVFRILLLLYALEYY